MTESFIPETPSSASPRAAPSLGTWARTHLTPNSDPMDCTIAVMLKILDGKCKMGDDEKAIMAALYHAVADRAGQRLGAAEHALIARTRAGSDDALILEIYERRLLAETMISRPVMKAYKAWLRQAGILPRRPVTPDS